MSNAYIINELASIKAISEGLQQRATNLLAKMEGAKAPSSRKVKVLSFEQKEILLKKRLKTFVK